MYPRHGCCIDTGSDLVFFNVWTATYVAAIGFRARRISFSFQCKSCYDIQGFYITWVGIGM